LFPPSQNVGQPSVQKLVDSFGVDVAFSVDAQYVLREVLGCLTSNLLATCFTVETRRVTRAIQGAVGFIVRKWKALVRADCCEADDVTIGAYSVRNALTEFEQYSRCVVVWIADIERFIALGVLVLRGRGGK
jgi:hypothetical protein